MSKQKLYLVDGAGYFFRAYYAIRPLSNSQGLPTNAIYGFTQMLIKLLKDTNPEHIAVVFDTHEPTFRDEMYDKYKANRKAPPDDLIPQFPYFQKVVEALNIPALSKPGYEADDVIGTIVREAVAKGMEVVILSGDKDLMQLVSDKVIMWDTMRDKKYDIQGVEERFGVTPDKVIEVLGLQGDSSDNVPGVPGVGPKTAMKLIQDFGSIENVIKNSKKLKGKLKENIENFVDQARLSKALVTLEQKVPIQIDLDQLRRKPFDTEACHKLFRELEFSKLLADLAPRESIPKKGYRLVQEETELKKYFQAVKETKAVFSFDLETDSLDVMKAHPVGFSFSCKEGEAIYVPVGHTGVDAVRQLSLDFVLKELKKVLEDPAIEKVGQNLKYDMAILFRYGIEVENILCDTMIASYLLYPAGPHNLDDLSQQYLDHRTIRYSEVTGEGKKKKSFSEVNLEQARDYACEDADCAWRLTKLFLKELKTHGLERLFHDVEMPLMVVLLHMEISGVLVDRKALEKLSKEFGLELKKLEKKIYEEAEKKFNIQSPKQLAVVLFEDLKLPVLKKTKTGYSTSQEVLEELALKHSLPALILNFRSLAKLKSTYTDSLPALIHPETGRIHTSFNQTVAETGRLSSSNPNLQNIPIPSLARKKIRESFVAKRGFKLISADYSQIELRLLAHLSKDPGLLEAFEKGEDVHRKTASGLFDISLDKVSEDHRAVGKTVNFATIYGQGPYGLSQQLKIDIGESKKYIDSYFKRYPKVQKYKMEILEEAKSKGYVATLLGRKRYVLDLNHRNKNIQQNAERVAFNTVFQGSAADIIKLAMIEIEKKIPLISGESRMILQVHDELVFEVPEGDVSAISQMVRRTMEGVYSLSVPLTVDVGVGENWANAH